MTARAVKSCKFKPGQIVRDKRTPPAVRPEETAEMFVFVAVNPIEPNYSAYVVQLDEPIPAEGARLDLVCHDMYLAHLELVPIKELDAEMARLAAVVSRLEMMSRHLAADIVRRRGS
jgi:hypothetical protein